MHGLVPDNVDLQQLAMQALQSLAHPRPVPKPKTDRVRYLQRLYALRMEGMRMYRALPHLEQFHETSCLWRLLWGSTRASKTETAMAEAVRAWTGTDPYDKYPRINGNSIVVGKDNDQLAMLWRKATESSFMMIPDEHTKLWRAVRPDPNDPAHLDPYDVAYREKWKNAPPLLPERFIKSVAMEDVGKGVPRVVTFITGWRSLWRSSNSPPAQGDHYNFALLDEQLLHEDHYYQVTRGLAGLASDTHTPKGIWSGTGEKVNRQLYELYEAAEAGSPDIRAFKCLLSMNPFMPDDAKASYAASLPEDQRRIKIDGIWAMVQHNIYSIYDAMGVHGCDPFALPADWARWVILDPGRTHCGTLILAVDPEERHRWVCQAFEIRKNDADRWAAELARRQGDQKFEGIICDLHGGCQRGMTGGLSVAEQYAVAARKAGIVTRQSGSEVGMAWFFPACANVEARELALLNWMQIRSAPPFRGTPMLQVMRGVFPDLDKQIKGACTDPDRQNKRKKDKHRPEDLVTCLEYAAAFNPPYWPPEPLESEPPQRHKLPIDFLRAKQKRGYRLSDLYLPQTQ